METWAEAVILIRYPATRRKTRVFGLGNNHGFPARFNFSSWGGVAFGGSTRKDLVLCCGGGTNEKAVVVGDGEVFSVTSRSKCDVDYLGQSTKVDLNVKFERLEAFGINGHVTLEGRIEEVARMKAEEAEGLLRELGLPVRTLNLRSISAIGYEMDYTLMHYNVMAWEGRAYDYCMENLRNMGFPVDGLSFDPDLVIRDLVIDKERGNLVKADRFGEIYGRELVDLRKESQWEFLNNLFSVSEAVAFMQMVDRLDDGSVVEEVGPHDYKGLYKAVSKALFRAHVEGQLKNEIMSKPELFVEPDPELPLALLDQKEADFFPMIWAGKTCLTL